MVIKIFTVFRALVPKLYAKKYDLVSVKKDPEEDAGVDSRKMALEFLDCLTSPKDSNDPEYDYEKDARRSQLLSSTDYSELKVELRARGLDTSGDKMEMMLRLLVHIIDPTMNIEDR
jgi:hypothetical protein